MKTLLCLICCIGGISIASAQLLQYPHGPLFAGSGAYNARFTDLFSFFSNTASLALCSRPAAGIYAENKFGLKELNSFSAAAQLPVRNGAIGFITAYSGSADFNRSQIGLAYGKQLGRVNIGVRFNYTMIRIAGYGSDGAVSFELGTTWKISEKLFTGIQIINPQGGRFGSDKAEKLPSVYSAGAGYECSDQLLISTIITKEENKPVNVQAIIQYTIAGRLQTNIGINSINSTPSLGLGWVWKNMRILMNGSFHPQLGPSTGMGIIFYGPKKEE